MHPEKRARRRQLLAQRRSLPASTWRDWSDRLCQNLRALPPFQQAETVLAYVSHRQEPDLSPLWQDLEKRWGLPRCVGRELYWHRWWRDRPLQPGAYGILEPEADAPLIDANEVDLILVPAVAGDRQGYRLGYGGGFYDRMLQLPEWFAVPTIGILFHSALQDSLPVEPWDRPLTGFCSEVGWHPRTTA
ncbi:MAG: 5-formyltetrahydrofolate cyclo-ligase [Spirulinaceae cyanobacterium RM2_2_10]|nr:5-formyltetrahydrofolate cyclo-ligase [Spirulinaceae cyanobacterium SM2_1_0]NJO20263.1 5-formyltetrahydrofolate cyclo-ligase [Spirulinaceae cyanobacterium RM2_2_10]